MEPGITWYDIDPGELVGQGGVQEPGISPR
jgi:hypothetical protein